MSSKTYTTFNIAKLLDVYPTTIAKWVDNKKLKAFVTPGGHRRITQADLLEFLIKYDMPVPEELMTKNIKKVLIVDDDDAMLSTLVRLFEKYPEIYEFATAKDGFAAGHALVAYDPDLVLLDLYLPGIDGFSICRTIKEKHSKTKVIAITGHDTESNRAEIMASGADAYLTKPFDVQELLETASKLCFETAAEISALHKKI